MDKAISIGTLQDCKYTYKLWTAITSYHMLYNFTTK
jgi:hypothetical protein